jgi:hypothetical protein
MNAKKGLELIFKGKKIQYDPKQQLSTVVGDI